MMASAKQALSKMIEVVSPVSRRDRWLLRTVKQELLPQSFESMENYVPQRQIGHAGFGLDVDSQLEFVGSLRKEEFQALFEHLRNNEEINSGSGGRDYKNRGLIHNGFYPTPDAEIYAAMIYSAKPNRIIEIGSGYSTVIARTTVEHIGMKCEIRVIDPQPRRDVVGIADHIEYRPVEHSSLATIESLANGTLLFIDSSHVCRSRGDLPFLYCNLLPVLPAGVLIHIHDIFTPFDYPDNYFERFYTEQYLLQALLANSTKFEVVLATHYLTREYPEAMQAVFGPEVGRDPLFYGASFWMKSNEKSAEQALAPGSPLRKEASK